MPTWVGWAWTPAVGAEVADALAACSRSVDALTDPSAGPFDLVVLVRPDRRAVRAAVATMAPGGAVRIEAPHRRWRGAILRDLVTGGLDVSTWWARPAGPPPTCLVRLDHPPLGGHHLADRRRPGPARPSARPSSPAPVWFVG